MEPTSAALEQEWNRRQLEPDASRPAFRVWRYVWPGIVLGVSQRSRLAGVLAAKRTPDLIPLCHPLLLTYVNVDAALDKTGVRFLATVSCTGTTGVEMEALTAASMAALTLYDMVKAVEKAATIEKVQLLEKSGGKSGEWHEGDPTTPAE